MTPEKQQELAILHKQWLQDPVTRQLLVMLENHVLTIANKNGDNATKSDVTSEVVRVVAGQVATTMTIRKMISDTDSFINNISKQQ